MKEKNQKRLKKICHAIFWMTIGAVGAAVAYQIRGSKVVEENRDLKVKNKQNYRRIKALEHKNETTFIRGIRVGRELENS